MKSSCTYCNSLKRAIGDANYCSKEGDTIADVSSNAYYFNTNHLYSGEHISRLSIRTIADGYQRYKVDKRNFLLDKDKYLVIPEGMNFTSELTTNSPIEGILVAFRTKDVQRMIKHSISSDEELLDDPFSCENYRFGYSAESIDISPQFYNLMLAIKNGVKHRAESSTYFEELFDQLLAKVVQDKIKEDDRVNAIKSTRKSTKQEISRRLKMAREYIDGNVNKDLSLDVLSKIAMMSKFHLARNFTDYYQQSPRQYIIKKRLERAKFLLLDTDENLASILQQIGLQNKSSFTRLFMKMEGVTTAQFRALA